MKKIFPIFLLLALLPCLMSGQKIDNTASFRDMDSNSFFRFNYDNDFLTSSDRYYTQGANFELVSPVLKKNPLNLLLHIGGNRFEYGLSLIHLAYTPTSILDNHIRYGDRPFAAAIMLKSFMVATDTISHSRIITSLNIGLIGPGAFGGEMQSKIHQWTGNVVPVGWQYQIKNDLILNYEIGYEKQLIHSGDIFSLQANSTLNVGTLFTNMSVGMNAQIGIINSPFAAKQETKTFQLYAYTQPLINLIGYDATLQGGLFNKQSPYTIHNRDIERLTSQNNYGIVLKYKRIYLEYSRAILTREFKSGNPNKWGGIRIGLKL